MSGVLRRLFRRDPNEFHTAEHPYPPGLRAQNASVKGMAPKHCLKGGTYDVPDLVAAIRWYGECFGLRVRSKSGDTAALDATGETFQLRAVRDPSKVEPKKNALFAVEHLPTVKQRLKDLGAQLVLEETPEDGGAPVFVYADPWGNRLRLTARA